MVDKTNDMQYNRNYEALVEAYSDGRNNQC